MTWLRHEFFLVVVLLLMVFISLFFIQIFFRVLNKHSSCISSISSRRAYNSRSYVTIRPVFMDKVQVKSKEQQVECKKVNDFTDASFHKNWIFDSFD